MSFVTKDSGERQTWETGSRRDTQNDKPRYDLIPLSPLRRLAELYARGAVKYGDRNWERGQPISRYYASMFRHMVQWACGDRDEDHLAAVVWNAMAIMWTEEQVGDGRLPNTLADFPVPVDVVPPDADPPTTDSRGEEWYGVGEVFRGPASAAHPMPQLRGIGSPPVK